jgi:hypothetical protein
MERRLPEKGASSFLISLICFVYRICPRNARKKKGKPEKEDALLVYSPAVNCLSRKSCRLSHRFLNFSEQRTDRVSSIPTNAIESKAAYKTGETLEQMRAKIDLSDQQKVFAGDSRHKGFIFRNYVTLPATAAAHQHLSQANGKK